MKLVTWRKIGCAIQMVVKYDDNSIAIYYVNSGKVIDISKALKKKSSF